MDWESLEGGMVDGLSLGLVLGLAWWIVRADYRRRMAPASPPAGSRATGAPGAGGTRLAAALGLLGGGALLRWVAGDRFPAVALVAILAAGAGAVVMGIYLEGRLGEIRREEDSEGEATSSLRGSRGARPSSPSGTP
jgi:hypothetical protein